MPAGAPASAFRDSTRITSWTRFLLYFNVLICAAWIVSDMMQLQLLTTAPYSIEEAEANDARQQIVGIAYLLSLVVTAVAFSTWVYRAGFNARQLGAQDMRYTPGWAVGWYFVPLFSFWEPYRAMKEIWQASKNPAAWQSDPEPILLSRWWCAWVVTCIGGNLSLKLSTAAKTVDALIASTWISMAVSVVTITSAVLAAKVVEQIHSMQTQRASQMSIVQ